MANASIESLKEIVDPLSLITALGFNIYYDNPDEIRASCVLHGGDNKTAFCFRKSVRRFYCFTRGCEVDESGEVNNDIISLVMKAHHCSFVEAVTFLSQLTGYDVELGEINDEEERRVKNDRDRKKFVDGVKRKTLDTLDESVIQRYQRNGCKYFLDMGFSTAVVDFFELGTMYDEFEVERATIPIRDESGRLVSISGRRTDGAGEPRYKLAKNFKKRRVLYNLHNALEYLDAYKRTIIIVEGFKALWHVVSCGYPNVVAVMGRTITQEQINLLVKCGFSCSLLLLDGDEKGRAGTERSKELLKGKMDTRPIYLPEDISPDDVEYDKLFSLISMFM